MAYPRTYVWRCGDHAMFNVHFSYVDPIHARRGKDCFAHNKLMHSALQRSNYLARSVSEEKTYAT